MNHDRVKADTPTTGAKGWLLLLCIYISIINPLSIFLMNIASLMIMRSSITMLLLILIAINTGLAVYCIVVGARLWAIKVGAAKQAKVMLLVLICIRLVEITFTLVRSDGSSGGIASQIPTLVLMAISWCYLHTSKRVKSTFVAISGVDKHE